MTDWNKHAVFDLHLHSLWSYDANADVEYYFSRARELGLVAFAITDHHNFDAADEIFEVAEKFPGTGFILGAEMSGKTSFGVFDLVCLGLPRIPGAKLQRVFDIYHQLQCFWGDEFSRILQSRGYPYDCSQREKLLRLYRAERAIAKHGITLVRNEIQMNYLLDNGYINSPREYWEINGAATSGNGSFEATHYLEGKEIIEAVHESGGVVLIAHPHEYFNGMDEARMDAIFAELPLDGIECAHSLVPEEYTRFYRKYCLKHRLLSSGGSDCHEDPRNAKWNLSLGWEMAKHSGVPQWLEEISEKVKIWNKNT